MALGNYGIQVIRRQYVNIDKGWYQGFYQYQPFCWNFIKVFRTYHKLGHFQGKRSLDKRRDFSVYVLKINAQEWRHARGILEYANTTIQWEGSICKTQIDVQTLIDVQSSNPCPISTSQTSVPQIYVLFQILKPMAVSHFLKSTSNDVTDICPHPKPNPNLNPNHNPNPNTNQ